MTAILERESAIEATDSEIAETITAMFGEKTPDLTAEEVGVRVSQMLDGVQYERNLVCTCFDAIPVERLAELGQKNAEIVQQIQDLEEEASRVAKVFKARIAALDGDVRDRSRVIRAKVESVEVDCQELFDRTYGRAYIVRTDTGEVIENRPLSEREQQLYMQLTDEDETGDEQDGDDEDGGEATETPETSDEPEVPLTPAQARKKARELAAASEGE